MVNKDGTIQAEKVIRNQHYKVVGTSYGSDNKVWSARDTIVNLTNGNRVTKTRIEWYNLFKKF